MGTLDKFREYGGMTEWSESEIEQIIIYKVDKMLEDYYWEYVAPLEKQLIKLGVKPKFKSQEITFRPNRNHKFYLNNKWEIFFTTLMFELWNAGFLIKPKNSDYRLEDKFNPNTMNFVKCFSGINGLSRDADQPTWQNNNRGGLELCVYFIDELIRLKIITDHKKDLMIEKVFGIKDPTRKRQKFQTYSSTDFKPKRHKEIDLIIETSIKKMDSI